MGINFDVNVKIMLDLIYQFNGVGDKEENVWMLLILQCVDVGVWKYFVLEVDDFVLSLQICVVCMLLNCGVGIGISLYFSYGVLLDDGDNGIVMDLFFIIVLVFRCGLWYVGVCNFIIILLLDFDLYWCVESCVVLIIFMERVLVDEWGELLFNLYYGFVGGDSLIYLLWFFLFEVVLVGIISLKNWIFFFMEVL